MKKLAERFFSKIQFEPNSGCWIWDAHVNKRWGYGQFWDGTSVVGAHRFSYELANGPIPAGLEPDHKCRVRCCVNPDHLEAVTRRENLLRGETIPARRAGQTKCQNGHPFTDKNTYYAKNGSRSCRICRRDLSIAWANKNRDRRRELDRICYRKRVAATARM